MAILRLAKVIDTTTTAAVRLLSGSTTTASSMTDHHPNRNTNNHNIIKNNYWMMYEISDNESQTATSSSSSAACWDSHPYRIWDNNHHTNDDDYLEWNHMSQSPLLQPCGGGGGGSGCCCCCSSWDNMRTWQQLVYRTLFWCKQIVFKVGRRYYTVLPIGLLLSTVLIGVGIGYVIGHYQYGCRGGGESNSRRRPEQSPPPPPAQQTRDIPSKQQQPPLTFTNAIISFILRLNFVVWSAVEFAQRSLLLLQYFYYVCSFYYRPTQAPPVPPPDLNQDEGMKSSPSVVDTIRQQNEDDDLSSERLDNRYSVNNRPAVIVPSPSSCCTDDDSKDQRNKATDIEYKEQLARVQLRSSDETQYESGLLPQELPHHIAVVMDGNRRYGQEKYNDPVRGHWDGSKKLVQFVKWCLAEQIQELTVYALSTENWNRPTNEITALMNIIVQHCEELRIEAISKHISIHIKSTDTDSIPGHVQTVLRQLEIDTVQTNPTLRMNICLSYGSRGEIVQACRSIVTEYLMEETNHQQQQRQNWTSVAAQITEDRISEKLLISSSSSSSSSCQHTRSSTGSHAPDIFIRTSGEIRLSNFLLWQMAYTELFFIQKNWPELNKDDFINVLRSYAYCRQRRFGQ